MAERVEGLVTSQQRLLRDVSHELRWAHLFEPFYRVDDAREREGGGYGIGLAITERTIRRHGGAVRARNYPGGGLLVELELPLNRSEV